MLLFGDLPISNSGTPDQKDTALTVARQPEIFTQFLFQFPLRKYLQHKVSLQYYLNRTEGTSMSVKKLFKKET